MLRETSSHLFEVLRLGKREAAAFREIRREAIGKHPEAFGTTLGEESGHADAWYVDKLETDTVLGGYDLIGGLSGTVTLGRRRTTGRRRIATLSGMYVRPSARGRGLSRLLLDTAISDAFEDGLSLLLAVTATNEVAIRLYHSAGFREWAGHALMPTLEGMDTPQMLMRLDR